MAIYRLLQDAYTRPNNTDAYSIGDAVSDSATTPRCLTFANALPVKGPAWVVGVTMLDSVVPTTAGQFRLWLFNGSVAIPDSGAAFDDNAALALPDGVVNGSTNRLLAVVELDTWYSTGLANFSNVFTPPIPLDASMSLNLYGILSVANAYQSSAASNILTVRLIIEQDVQY